MMNVRGELCSILGPKGLPHDKYERLVHLLESQESRIDGLRRAPAGPAQDARVLEQKVHDRGAEIVRCNDHIHNLKATLAERDELISKQDCKIKGFRGEVSALRKQLDDEHDKRKTDVDVLRRQLDGEYEKRKATTMRGDRSSSKKLLEQEKRIKDLQRRNIQLEDVLEEQDTALLLATAFQKKALEFRQQLQHKIRQRDEQILSLQQQITTLRDQIYQITNAASLGEAASLALEVQAQANLKHVKGLQADLAEREAQIEELNAAKLRFMRDVKERQDTLISNHKKLVLECKEAKVRAMDSTIALNNANIKAAELEKIAESQQDLINQLVASNQSE